jgi:hypothetical protein
VDCLRLKDPRVCALCVVLCGAASGCAGDLAENRSKRPTQSIGGVSVAEPTIDGLEMESD